MDNPDYIPFYVAGCLLALAVVLGTKFRPWLRYALTIGAMILPVLIVAALEKV